MTQENQIPLNTDSSSTGDVPGSPRTGDNQIPPPPARTSPDESPKSTSKLTPQSTIAAFAERYSHRYFKGKKKSAQVTYRNILKYSILPALGNEAIEELDDVDALEELLVGWEEDGVTRSTIDGRLSVLSLVIDAAVTRHLIKANHLKFARKVLKRKTKSRVRPFTVQEEMSLVVAIREQPRMYACFFLLLLRTGMRVGEALGLKIDDIDLTNRWINIERTWTCGEEDTPKYESARRIAIAEDLFVVLSEYIAFIREDQRLRWLAPTEWLFPGVSRLRPITLGGLRRNFWKPMLATHGIPYHRIHDLRHTFATGILERGHSIRTLQQLSAWLGHSSPDITLRVYAHLFTGDHLVLVSEVGCRPDPLAFRHCPACQQPLPGLFPHP